MKYILKGIFPTIPPKAQWWGAEIYDGRDWIRCDDTETTEKGKTKKVRWWPTSTPPTPEFLGEGWGSGWYRLTFTSHDKRKHLQVTEPFALMDPADPNLQNLLQAMGGGPANHQLLNPEQVMSLPPHMAPAAADCRCTHCGRSEAETPLAQFQAMYFLLERDLSRKAEQDRSHMRLMVEDIKAQRDVAIEQTKSFFLAMQQVTLGPRLQALENQLQNMELEDGEIDMNNATTAALISAGAQHLGPILGAIVQKWMADNPTPPKLKGDD